MKILMMIPLWKRPEIVRLMIWRMETVLPDYAEIEPLFILSPEDPTLRTLEKFTEGYRTFYYSNEYLSDKLNAGLTYAMQFDWDYYMGMGSDNIYTHLLWELYRDEFESNTLCFGLNDCYVYDIVNERAMYLHKYVHEFQLGGIGAGRCISRDVIEETGPVLWRPKKNSGMDGFSGMYLFNKGFKINLLETEGRPVLLDIKTNTNLSHILHVWESREREVPVAWIKCEFGLMDADIMDSGAFDLVNFDNFHGQVCKMSQEIRKEDAFNSINTRYEIAFGEKRFKNYDTYREIVRRRYNGI